MPSHRHTYQRANLTAEVIPCDSCGEPADAATRRRLRRQLARLKAANRVLGKLGGGAR